MVRQRSSRCSLRYVQLLLNDVCRPPGEGAAFGLLVGPLGVDSCHWHRAPIGHFRSSSCRNIAAPMTGLQDTADVARRPPSRGEISEGVVQELVVPAGIEVLSKVCSSRERTHQVGRSVAPGRLLLHHDLARSFALHAFVGQRQGSSGIPRSSLRCLSAAQPRPIGPPAHFTTMVA